MRFAIVWYVRPLVLLRKVLFSFTVGCNTGLGPMSSTLAGWSGDGSLYPASSTKTGQRRKDRNSRSILTRRMEWPLCTAQENCVSGWHAGTSRNPYSWQQCGREPIALATPASAACLLVQRQLSSATCAERAHGPDMCKV